MVCLGSAVSWNRQDCNSQSMQRVQNQARGQLGTLGRAKSFLRGAQIFQTLNLKKELLMSNSFKLYPTHFSREGENFFCASPPSYGPVQSTSSIWTGLCLNARTQNVVF